jgi:hypothetical protein
MLRESSAIAITNDNAQETRFAVPCKSALVVAPVPDDPSCIEPESAQAIPLAKISAADRRDRGHDLQLGRRLARAWRARAQLFLRRGNGTRLLARVGVGAWQAGQTRHLPTGRRQPVDESRLPGNDHRGSAQEPRPPRGAERHLRGERRASDPEPQDQFRDHGARGGLSARPRILESSIFEQQAGQVLRQEGPVFATLHVERSQQPLTYDYPKLYDPARRQALKAALMRQ